MTNYLELSFRQVDEQSDETSVISAPAFDTVIDTMGQAFHWWTHQAKQACSEVATAEEGIAPAVGLLASNI